MGERIAYDTIYDPHGLAVFAVSTINRECSSMYGGVYAETMVFALDASGRYAGIRDQGESYRDSAHTHGAMLEKWTAIAHGRRSEDGGE